ncbi:GNAT family N-acetyltransferase [Streptosporangiaceae bacterium NEAU-GS5]|nr:GNAT family N-acetyltransferase [Streptosporangiaceae bacterium NEAU-GS5]
MADVTIRHGSKDDVDEILAFWRLAAEGTDRRDSPEAYLTLVGRDPQAVLVAEIDGAMVGTLLAGWDGWRAHLYRLAVHPEHRRRGIARRFQALGAMRSDAMVLDDNTSAHPTWADSGYSRQPECSRWVKLLK